MSAFKRLLCSGPDPCSSNFDTSRVRFGVLLWDSATDMTRAADDAYVKSERLIIGVSFSAPSELVANAPGPVLRARGRYAASLACWTTQRYTLEWGYCFGTPSYTPHASHDPAYIALSLISPTASSDIFPPARPTNCHVLNPHLERLQAAALARRSRLGLHGMTTATLAADTTFTLSASKRLLLFWRGGLETRIAWISDTTVQKCLRRSRIFKSTRTLLPRDEDLGSALAQVCARLTTGLTPSSRPSPRRALPWHQREVRVDTYRAPRCSSCSLAPFASLWRSTFFGGFNDFLGMEAPVRSLRARRWMYILHCALILERSPARSPPALASYFRAVHIDTKSLDDTPGGADIAMTRLWNRSPSLKTPRLSSWFLPRHYKPNYWSKRRSIRRIQALTPSSQQRCPLHFGCFLTPHEIEPGGLGYPALLNMGCVVLPSSAYREASASAVHS
ncbi:hypothetical protein B0H14DRAFT_3444081 [Mycena olivaceomarginata]|nr:hypothetical protein B0H14DRAFT_3444081 [Mycena olivaceomarginata]